MADNTIIQQGKFTSAGVAKTLTIRSDFDYIEVDNETALAQAGSDLGYHFQWQRGMTNGRGIVWSKLGTVANDPVTVAQIAANAGFTVVDSSVQAPGTLNATITAVSNAAIPVVSNSGTNGLVAGDIVRIINVSGAQQLGGYDFTVGYNTLSSGTFSLDYMAQIVAGTTGSWRKINFDPIFYPRHRYITKITAATSAVVTMSVTHGFTVGQAVRFIVPAAFGMVEMDGLQGTITAIDTTTTTGNTITVDIDSSAFTTFSFPLTAAVPFSPALVVPIGEDTAEALDASQQLLADATRNTAFIGVKLAAGNSSPAGNTSDVIYWRAYKAFSVNNE